MTIWPFRKKRRPLGEVEKTLLRRQVLGGVSERRIRSEWGDYVGFDDYYTRLLSGTEGADEGVHP